jgi:hypothetical protein
MSIKRKTILSLVFISLFMIPFINACSTGCNGCATDQAAVAPEDCAACKTADGYYSKSGATDPMACYYKTTPPAGFFFDATNNVFKSCYTTCKYCSGPSDDAAAQKCEVCKEGALVPGTSNCKKSDEAVSGFFWNTDKWTKCWDGCTTCASAGAVDNHNCSVCADTYLKLTDAGNTFCYKKTTPPQGYFLKAQTDTAFTKCGTSCATCAAEANGNNQNCSSCINPDTLKLFVKDGNTTCENIQTPPTGYTWNTTLKAWQLNAGCFESCALCSAAGDATTNNCLTCKAGYLQLSDKTTQCSKTNPGSYFLDAGKSQWAKCNAACGTCNDASSCDTCAAGKSKDPNQKLCVETCPEGTFKDSNKCRPCVFPCKTCSNQDTCISCANTELYTINTNSNKCDPKCFNTTIGIFKDNVGVCGTCAAGCSKCTNPFTCTECAANYFKFQDNCVSACPAGFYQKEVTGVKTCLPCNSACATCADETTKCTSCAVGIVRNPDRSCVVACDGGQTPDAGGNCKTCVELGNYKFQDNCVKSCPPGLFPNNGVCMTCKDSGRYLYNNSCVSQCPTGFVFSATNVCFFQNNVTPDMSIIYSENTDILECDPQPCRNGGVCQTDRVNVQNVNYCECPNGFYGRRCEYKYTDGQSSDWLIQNYQWIYKTPDVLSNDLYDIIRNSANESLKTNAKNTINTTDIDYHLLDLADVAMFSNTYKTTKNPGSLSAYSLEIKTLKENLEAYMKAIMTTSEVVRTRLATSRMEYTNVNFNIAIFTSNAMQKTRLLQDQWTTNTFIDFTNCEKAVRVKYNIPETQAIIVNKFEYSKTSLPADIRIKDVTSDYSTKIFFYNSATKEQLITDVCGGDNGIIYSLPIKTKTGIIDIEKYHADKGDNFEPFDSTSYPYSTRCVRKFDSMYGADTTINYRRKVYWQGRNARCNDGCEYLGIDASNYFKCLCTSANNEVYYYFEESAFPDLRTVNLDIVTCPHIAFVRPDIHFSPGFYVGLLLNIFFILQLFFLCCFRTSVIKGDTTSLYYFDYRNKEDANRDSPYEFVKPKQGIEMGGSSKKIEKDLEKPEPVRRPADNNEHGQEKPKQEGGVLLTADSILLEEKNDGKQVTLFTSSKKGETGLRAKPKNSGSPPDAKKIRITLRDIESYSAAEAITRGVDQRGVCHWFSDYLADRTFFSLFAKTSILTPLWVRFSYVLLFWSILWTINAMMFSDEYIDERVKHPQADRVS